MCTARSLALLRSVLLVVLAAFVFVGRAAAFETSAPTAILVDVATKRVLFEKNADDPIPPASLAKLMTAAVVFDALKDGKASKDETFTVSERAWREGGASSGGSTMFLPLGKTVTLGDLIKGLIIQSGNDAAIVIAEGLAGSEAAFAQRMNAEAKKIGLSHSHFVNPHGLPAPGEVVTMHDLAVLAQYLIETFPDEYPLFSEERFTYNGITQRNRNPLLALGADGLKTGYTDASGYGLVASAKRDGRRIVLAMSGMKSATERAREAKRLMDFGLQDFQEVTLIAADQVVGAATISAGTKTSVPLIAAKSLTMLVPRGSLADVKRQLVSNGPLPAPVKKGQRAGWAVFSRGDETLREVPLYAAEDIPRAGIFARIADTVAGHFAPLRK
ncbi:D-alanyl-D-alanine carboxypeptidase [Jiella sp. MQZ9-1]|uniref:serine-type D-Ala-D-Ala carboxypeptidase n=1 Tax=Jiella flava TaxID=2816857 RepID=A0A939FVU9_9HYPH|nr:D-alanyl-D-alanine carboxypeptidase family protein [Jiella flava]MBO0661003.1 D-alanyl-D-alanine carboxypeptidase [Jiella flava]MCD2469651.1 D-alanyl-D-alanine carboxypeptidase [Jiella flava]